MIGDHSLAWLRAQQIANSDRVMSVFAAPEWDELHDDGKSWAFAIIEEAWERAQEDSATRIQALEAALRRWQCGSCGGTGVYRNKSFDDQRGHVVETPVECKVCLGSGQHPIAFAALGTGEVTL